MQILGLHPYIKGVVGAASPAATSIDVGELTVRPGQAQVGISSRCDGRNSGAERIRGVVAQIEIAASEQIGIFYVIEMNAVRATVSDFENSVSRQLPLHVKAPELCLSGVDVRVRR